MKMESDKEVNNEDQKNGCCSRGHCCCGKAIAAIVLLLIGGTIGYLWGSRCSMHKMACASQKTQSSCPMTHPAPETPPPAK